MGMLFRSKFKASQTTSADDTILHVKPSPGALAEKVVQGKIVRKNTPADGIQIAAEAPPEKATPEESINEAKDSSKEANVETKGKKGSSKNYLGRFLPSKTNQAKLKVEPSVSVENQQ